MSRSHWYDPPIGARLAAAAEGGQGGLTVRGEWDPATAYEPNDLVQRNNISWFALSANTDIDPGTTGLPHLAGATSSRLTDAGAMGQPFKQGFTLNADATVAALDVGVAGGNLTVGQHIGISAAFSGSNPAWLAKHTVISADTGAGLHNLTLDAQVQLSAGTTYYFVSESPLLTTAFEALGNLTGILGAMVGHVLYGSGFNTDLPNTTAGFGLYAVSAPVWQQIVGADVVLGPKQPATTPGTVVGKVQAFDITGASLGYLPLYDAIS